MHRLFGLFSVAVFIAANLATCLTSLMAQGNRVELEVVIGNDVSIDRRQQWAELLANVGADSVRVRSANAGDKIRVSVTPSGDHEICKIIGQVTRRNQLVLPGGTFSTRDVAGIKSLIQKIRDDGAEIALSDKKAFGLTSRQLVDLHNQLGEVYLDSTKGVTVAEIISKVQNSIDTRMVLNDEAKEILREEFPIEDELAGLSCGTVLAAALRPLGLVAMPHRPQGGETRIVVVESGQAEEHWPIGWPNDQAKGKAAPGFYDTFSIRIENYGLRDVLDAIEKKSGLNFVYDYNSLAEKGIELNETKVSLIEEKISYSRAINKLLGRSKLFLKADMRVDEKGKAFLWITTLR